LTLRIRAAAPGDVPLIADLIRQLAKFEKLEDKVVLTEDLLRTGLFGARPFAETIIAEEDTKPIGFALFFHTFSTFLARPGIYLEDLFVLAEHRGHGVGRALLAHLAHLAVERGCGRLEWAVLNWNQDAIRFYERLGARPNSEWTVYRLAGEALASLGRE
jgi:GNAT superfamily N-acetyltransferase